MVSPKRRKVVVGVINEFLKFICKSSESFDKLIITNCVFIMCSPAGNSSQIIIQRRDSINSRDKSRVGRRSFGEYSRRM